MTMDTIATTMSQLTNRYPETLDIGILEGLYLPSDNSRPLAWKIPSFQDYTLESRCIKQDMKD